MLECRKHTDRATSRAIKPPRPLHSREQKVNRESERIVDAIINPLHSHPSAPVCFSFIWCFPPGGNTEPRNRLNIFTSNESGGCQSRAMCFNSLFVYCSMFIYAYACRKRNTETRIVPFSKHDYVFMHNVTSDCCKSHCQMATWLMCLWESSDLHKFLTCLSVCMCVWQ